MNVSEAIAAARHANGSAPPAQRQGGCTAADCPCVGSIDVGRTGRAFCSWHAWATADQWPSITNALLAHRWLIDFIGELTALQDTGRRADWVRRASLFWADELRCAPTSDEALRWNLYCWRLREELAWRVGVRKEQPEPRTPMAQQPEWLKRKAEASRVIEAAQVGAPVSRAAITAALRVTGDLPPVPESDDEALWAAQMADAA